MERLAGKAHEKTEVHVVAEAHERAEDNPECFVEAELGHVPTYLQAKPSNADKQKPSTCCLLHVD